MKNKEPLVEAKKNKLLAKNKKITRVVDGGVVKNTPCMVVKKDLSKAVENTKSLANFWYINEQLQPPKTNNVRILSILKALYQKMAIYENSVAQKLSLGANFDIYLKKPAITGYGFTHRQEIECLLAKAFFTLNNVNKHYTLTCEAIENLICSLFNFYQVALVEEFSFLEVSAISKKEKELDAHLEDEILSTEEINKVTPCRKCKKEITIYDREEFLNSILCKECAEKVEKKDAS